MHWVVQSGMYNEQGFESLLNAIKGLQLKCTVTKCIPFASTMEPEPVIEANESVIVMGTVTMARVAKERGWKPGSFLNDNFDFQVQLEYWQETMLNAQAQVLPLRDVAFFPEPVFMRPTLDSKSFSGKVYDWGEFQEWRTRVLALTPEDTPTVTGDTVVMVCPNQKLYREWRTWMVDGKCVTASGYKTGSRVHYDPVVDPAVVTFCEQLDAQWRPASAYCLDICQTSEGLFVVEVNNLNSAGFYAADMNRLVQALEENA